MSTTRTARATAKCLCVLARARWRRRMVSAFVILEQEARSATHLNSGTDIDVPSLATTEMGKEVQAWASLNPSHNKRPPAQQGPFATKTTTTTVPAVTVTVPTFLRAFPLPASVQAKLRHETSQGQEHVGALASLAGLPGRWRASSRRQCWSCPLAAHSARSSASRHRLAAAPMADLVRSRARRGSSGGGSARRPHSRGAPRTPPPTGWSPHRPPADRSREVKDRLRQADAAHAASRYRRAEATAAAAAADSFEEHAAQRRQWRQQQVEAQLLEQERTSRAQHQGREYRAAQRHLLLDDEQELERTRAELQASRKSKAARSSRGERQGICQEHRARTPRHANERAGIQHAGGMWGGGGAPKHALCSLPSH